METQSNKSNEKREALKELSKEVADLVISGDFETINEALIAHYKNKTHKEFKSYRQWLAEGMQVKKGEKAFLLWAKPMAIKKGGEVLEDEKNEPIKYFPIAYLFSNAQVEPKKGDQNNG